jgi:RNA polymerase sigma factor (sigma-70 family)
MLYSKNVETFVSSNQEEIRKLAHSICIRHNVSAVDDIVQEFYLQLIHRKLLKKYDPNHPSATKISTFLYTPIENIVRAYKNSENNFENHYRFESCRTPEYQKVARRRTPRHRVGLDCFDYPKYYEDGEGSAEEEQPHERRRSLYNGNIIDVDFENNICQNQITDSIDGINLDLNLFERYLKEKNKTYKLNRRKNKKIRTRGLSLLSVFRLMRSGYTNREIAKKYGVSDMWVTTLKHEIKGMLKKFGIVWNYYRERHDI